jgi:hypothetical protein
LYDLFKFTVALILLIVLLLLLVQRPAPNTPQALTPTSMPTKVPLVSTETLEPTPALTALPLLHDAPETLSLNPETKTLETSDGVPVYRFDEEMGEWVPVIPDELANTLDTDSELQSLTDGWVIESPNGEPAYLWDPETLSWKEVILETAETEETESEPVPEPEMEIDCPLAKPSRLVAGSNGVVTAPLNIRSSPGIANNLLFTMSPGTELKIIGNPICLPQYKGAYLWWQVEIPGVQIGWSAEAPQNEDFYFIDPLE